MPGFPKFVSPKAKASKTLFRPVKPTNPSIQMDYKGQRSFGIISILYTYQSCKTLFGPIKSTNPSIQMAYKGQSSFGIISILYTYQACKILFGPIKLTIHQSEWPIKARAVLESLICHISISDLLFSSPTSMTNSISSLALI